MEANKNFKIFIVDDDTFSLSLFEQNMKNLGYNDITTFGNGTDCLNNLSQRPNVIFLDHNMDTLTGFEVLKKIKRFDPNIYVVMVSAQEDLKTAVNSMKYGVFDYIMKGDDENRKMENVLLRISEIQETLKRKNSIIKKFLPFL